MSVPCRPYLSRLTYCKSMSGMHRVTEKIDAQQNCMTFKMGLHPASRCISLLSCATHSANNMMCSIRKE